MRTFLSRRLLLALVVTVTASAVTACAANSGSGGSRRDNNRIGLEEIEASPARNVYDLVRTSRPAWLQTRGTQSLRENSTATFFGDRGVTVQEGTGTIVAYLDNTRLGPVQELQQIPTVNAGSVEFLSAAAATNRWGGGHSHGVILVMTRTAR